MAARAIPAWIPPPVLPQIPGGGTHYEWLNVTFPYAKGPLRVLKASEAGMKALNPDLFVLLPWLENGRCVVYLGDLRHWFQLNTIDCEQGEERALVTETNGRILLGMFLRVNGVASKPFFSLGELKKMDDFVVRVLSRLKSMEKQEVLVTPFGTKHFITVRSGDSDGGRLPRTIRFFEDESIWLMFNQTKRGDPAVGDGLNKVVKRIFCLPEDRWLAQAVASDEKERETASLARTRAEAVFLFQLNGSRGILPIAGVFDHQSKKKVVCTEKGERPLNKCSLIMPLYQGDLLKKVSEIRSQANQDDHVAEDLLHGIVCLDKGKIVHLDLKLFNVLVDQDQGKNWRGYICDFGLAFRLTEGKAMRLQPCTPALASPEFASLLLEKGRREFSAEQFVSKLNCWQMGLILWYLWGIDFGGERGMSIRFHLWLLFSDRAKRIPRPPDEVLQQIRDLPQDFLGPEPKKGTRDHIVWMMLRPNWTERCTSQEALAEWEAIRSKKGGK